MFSPFGRKITYKRKYHLLSAKHMQARSMMTTLMLTGEPLSISDVVAVARAGRRVALAPSAIELIERARAMVETIVAERQVCYGVTTGFGALSKVSISTERLGELQHNLVRSHAAAVGAPLPADVVRAMLLLTAASLARGASGVRRAVVEALLALLNNDITPHVPARGSVGASGDLAPLAHIALVLIGEGQVIADCRLQIADYPNLQSTIYNLQSGGEALSHAGLA